MKSLDIRRTKNRPQVELRKVLPEKKTPLSTSPIKARRKIAAGLTVLVLLLVWVLSIFVLPEAKIQVIARSEPMTRDFEIRVDKNQTAPNTAELSIPGKFLEQEVSGSKNFTPTGRRNIGHAASGFVYIYNFSKTTLILKAQTTVLRANNRQYFFTQDIGNIRPTALLGLEEQEVDSTSLIPPVPVVASAPGEEYNLAKGARLEIENEAFGLKPKLLYAAVAESISGGTTQEVKVVTQGDIVSAYDALTRELVEGARRKLLQESSDLKLLDRAYEPMVLEQHSSAAVGAEAVEFEAGIKLKLRALVYNEREVRKIIRERIERVLPANKVLKNDRDGRLQSNFVSLNLDAGQATLYNHFEGEIAYKIDRQELLERVRGRSAEEIREILLSRPEIAGVEVRFYPFWVKKAPKFAKKIQLEISEQGP